MKLIKTFLLLLSFLPSLLFAQAELQTDLALPYLVHLPKVKSAHPPVLILMHGYGSNEADLFSLTDKLPQNFLVISIQAPFNIGEDSYQWFAMETVNGVMQGNRRDIQHSVNKIKTIVPALVSKYNADAAQVYLSGFSQGGMMSYEVGLSAPELFKGIAPMSGRLFAELQHKVKMSPALRRLRLFIGHGDADDRVAYSFATQANTFLKQMGLHPELHTYKGMQHSISQQETAELSKWLSKP